MNQFLTALVSILEIIIILGVLVSIHEAGHLAMAKAFNVYCFEYSIGFGHKIVKLRRRGGETYFCIGSIPFGGYVSMYGEQGSVPEGFEEPGPSRSLRAQAKWKQALIMVAGVVLNFILGLVLIFVSDIAFPQYYYGYGGVSIANNEKTAIVNSSFAYGEYGAATKSYLNEFANTHGLEGYTDKDFVLAYPGMIYENDPFHTTVLLSDDVRIAGLDGRYVACYYPSSLIADHSLADSFQIYPAEKISDTKDAALKRYEEPLAKLDIAYGPTTAALDQGAWSVSGAKEGTAMKMTIRLVPFSREDGKSDENFGARYYAQYQKGASLDVNFTASKGKWAFAEGDSSIAIRTIQSYLGWNGAWRKWAQDVPNACGAVVAGFGSLFTPGGFKNLSGIVGITAALPKLTAAGGAARIFYFSGLLSINLCFFNLLPFPGLDGWQLLTLAVEGVTKKRMSQKVSSIISFIGLALLIGLMVIVTVKDIIGLF